MTKKIKLAVVGATGAVGEMMLSILAARRFPVDKVYALASARSVGQTVYFGAEPLIVSDLASFDFSQVQLALFSAGSRIAADYVPAAVQQGCLVIDNSSCFRYQDSVPLVITEVNPQDIANYVHSGIIANPNCSTIQMLVALKPIYDAVGIERINVATYQSMSGAGRKAVLQMLAQAKDELEAKPIQSSAFNVRPMIGDIHASGYSQEEMKMIWETHKILGDTTIKVNPTCVRVPVLYGHSEAVHIETQDKITAAEARVLLSKAPGIELVDDPANQLYPMPVEHAAGKDLVYVGRIREDLSHSKGLNLWIVSDNLRKGAALNAVQIAEILSRAYLT
jgi:aspartate-semialdehyde dehydrogenase